MNWLNNLVEQHKELESPTSFWMWSGLAAISAAVKDNIWMDRQIFKLYPNIYVMLHADSGLKKGPPVSMAKKLVAPISGIHVISGRSSIQGILKQMGSGQTLPGGKVSRKSAVFIASSELSSSIVDDKVATKILTDLYDRQYNDGEWKSLLKMEEFQLKDPTVTMLTATNEAMSADFFTKSAIQGGYFARTFIIYEKEGQNTNSLIYKMEHTPNYNELSTYLQQLGELKGPFADLASNVKNDEYRYLKKIRGRDIWFNKVGLIYDDWYGEFKEQVKISELRDETGTMNRFGDSVLKVAMLLSLSEHPSLVLTENAMLTAISECERLLGNARKTTMGKHGMSNAALLKSLIIMELLGRENHQISRAILMKKLWMHYTNQAEFDDIMNSFDQNGMIKSHMLGPNLVYFMPETQVHELKQFMSGKQK